MIVTNPDNSLRQSNARLRQARIASALLALLALLLFSRGLRDRGRPSIDVPLWDLQQSSHLKALILTLSLEGMAVFLAYSVVGVLTILVFVRRKNMRVPMALALGIGLSAAVSSAGTGPGLHGPNPLDMILPILGCLLGSWIGVNWAAGGRARRWLPAKLVLLGLAGLFAITALGLAMIEAKPLGFEPATPVSDDRVRLTKLIRSKSPRGIPEGQTVTLSLAERDINILLAWGLSLATSDGKARVDLADDRVTLQASIRLPTGGDTLKYLNLVITGVAAVEEGIVRVHIAGLRVGRLGLPGPLLRLLSPALAAKIQREPLAVPMLAQIHRTEITRDRVSATYGRIDMPEGFRQDIFGSIGPSEQVYEALSEQFEQIAAMSQALPPPQERFGAFLQGAFRIAEQRSRANDPVVENRAAIIALGISLGHDIISEFVGTMPDKKIPGGSRRLMRQVRLRGRRDWSRHFFVSAALEVLSSEALSLDVGVLKEELDAGTPQGSGFSFADLAADRSGTLFGKTATHDAESARRLQQRLRMAFNVDDYFPPSSDFPENIPQQRLEAEYGGVNGKAYLRLLREIDRQILACPGYDASLP
ncbi:MAG: hypothetical protein IH892_17835 [Planctomycetes bacterium]|nr:hypothetical protein [Planctomycetota bacterium]